MFRRLLVATDFQDGLQRLAKFVPDLAANEFEQIIFLHCVPYRTEAEIPRVETEKIEQAKAFLSVAIDQAPAGLDVQVEVVSGKPVDCITATISKYQADLILLGMEIRTMLNETLFGSTTRGLSQRIQIPMLILRPQLVSVYTEEEMALRCQHLLRHLLIPYDGTDSAQEIVAFIKQHAAERQPDSSNSLVACTACWVIDKSGRRELQSPQQLEQAKAALQSVRADLEQAQLQVYTEARQGQPINEIEQLALEADISAIAVSSRHFGSLWELSIPSFTGELLRRCWFPILFIPPQKR